MTAMMQTWIFTLASVFLISLISFAGVLTLALKPSILQSVIHLLVSLSAGTLLGSAFFHLIPEATAIKGFSNITKTILTP